MGLLSKIGKPTTIEELIATVRKLKTSYDDLKIECVVRKEEYHRASKISVEKDNAYIITQDLAANAYEKLKAAEKLLLEQIRGEL